MTHVSLYPGDRRTGKTTALLQQAEQAVSMGQTVALIAPTKMQCRELKRATYQWDPEAPGEVHLFQEAMIEFNRGILFDHIFIDNADLFQDPPTWTVGRCFPGVPLTMTYTPYTRTLADIDADAERKRVRAEEIRARIEREWEDTLMVGWMLMKTREYQ